MSSNGKLGRMLQSLDLFGASYQIKFFDGKVKYTTIWGGVGTIVLVALSLTYFSLVMAQWINGEMIPKISSQLKLKDYNVVSFQQSPIKINFLGINKDVPDPFSETNNILTPVLISATNQNIKLNKTLLPTQPGQGSSSSVVIDDLELVINVAQANENTMKQQNQHIIALVRCQANLLTTGQTCASDQTIDNFLQTITPNLIINVNIYLQQYLIQEGIYSEVAKQFYFYMDQSTFAVHQILFKTTRMEVDEGVLISNPKEKNILSDVSIITQSLSKEFYPQIDGTKLEQILSAFLIRLDPLETQTFVQNISLGEVLAQIGSIVQIIMLARFLFITLNEYQLSSTLSKEMIYNFFPEYKQLDIQSTRKGKITSVKSRADGTIYDPIHFATNHQQIVKLCTSKFDLMNIHYLLCKLQLRLQQDHQQQSENSLKRYGYKIPLKKLDPHEESKSKGNEIEMFDLEVRPKIQPEATIQKQESVDEDEKLYSLEQFETFDRGKYREND